MQTHKKTTPKLIKLNNIAIGYLSLRFNTTGSCNTALGFCSLYSNTTGTSNTAVGYNAGCAITTGSNNVIIGSYGAVNFITSNSNIILATGAGTVQQLHNAQGAVSFGSTSSFGTAGQVLTSQGPAAAPAWATASGGGGLTTGTLNISEVTVVATTNTFSVSGGYVPGNLQVFGNGILLGSADYTATTSPTVIVNRARNPGDVMRFQALTTNFYSTNTYAYSVQEITATTGQTIFTIPGGYKIGATEVFLNGILLDSPSYTANNGSTVVLTTGTGIVTGAILRTHSFNSFALSGALPLSGGTVNGAVNVIGTLKQNNVSIIALNAAMSLALGA